MAGKPSVLRTYGRLHPLRRLQQQTWLSPVTDRNRLFSSSSSSNNASDDSDFLPPKRRKKVNCKKKLKPPEKPSVCRKRRKKKSQPESRSEVRDKENDNLPVRISDSPLTFSTPFRKFVTIRRKAPAASMKPLRGKPKRSTLSPLSPAFQGSEVKRRRKRCAEVITILDSSADALSSPLQKAPLLSSTPCVLLTAMPRTEQSFVRQLALCEPMEESVPIFSEATDREEKEAASYEDITGRVVDGSPRRVTDREPRVTCAESPEAEQCGGADNKDLNGTSELEFAISSTSANGPGSGVKCLSIKMSRGGSPLCILAPVSASSSESLICLDKSMKELHTREESRAFCASPELFSDEDFPHTNGSPPLCGAHPGDASPPMYGPGNASVRGFAEHDPRLSSRFLKGISADKWKYFRRKSFQPVVKLYSDAVSEYLRRQTNVLQGTCSQQTPKVLQETRSRQTPLQANVEQTSLVLPVRERSLRQMQPVVQLDPLYVTKYFKDKNLSKTQNIDPVLCLEALDTNLASPALHQGLRTPLMALSMPKGNVQNSAAPPQTTGRKVCISGFSMKRWGNRRKKSSKAQQQLSFQDCGDTSVFQCKENMSVCGSLSPLLLSSSLLTSSFLNSSAVKTLDLSSECVRDPQKDLQRWARLRAALSLHRKKKVEAGLPSSQLCDRKSANHSAHGNYSSLLLLSPFQSSLCCDDLTDAEKVLAECHQEKPITFQQCLTEDQLCQCQKVGEGVYGEVFRTLREDEFVALKIIPIEGSQKVNGEYQKSFAEILPEIIISKELSLLSGGEDNKTSGFIKLHSAYCVKGCYPKELLAAWDEFAEEKGTENERPDLFGEDQLFMILEFEFGGDDLERMSSKLPSVMASRSILHQVTAALAVAEEDLRFEHRDLHWGNLLIETCSYRTISASLQGKIFQIPTAGVQVKIIDYTLSRLDKDGLTVFCDLSTDEDLFLGEGDLQFDVYRGMREENQNSWSLYRPHSNVLWLHYLCDKLLSEVKYVRKPSSASYQKELRKLRDFRREVRQFSSAADILQRSKLFN